MKFLKTASMLEQFCEVCKRLKNVLKLLDALIQQSVIEQVDSAKMKDVVDSVVKDALVSKYQKVVLDKYMLQEPFNDTLFFLPVVEAILKLTGIFKR